MNWFHRHTWTIQSETETHVRLHCSKCGADKIYTKDCPHIWKETSRETHPSLIDSGQPFNIRFGGPDLERRITHREVVVSFKCERCGCEKVERI